MPLLDESTIAEAKQMDLLTYLRCFEPDELVHFSGNTYTTKTHDSLKISNGKWMWWSRGVGGYTALDYLIKVKEVPFVEAVETITGKTASYPLPIPKAESKPLKPKLLILPDKSASTNQISEYLFGRGIDLTIINDCIKKGLIFESLPHHNVVFVGKDAKGKPRYAAYRATNNSRIMGDATGSDKHFSFKMEGKNNRSVHLFECAIDTLSYATLLKMECQNWRNYNLLSLAGVYAPKQTIEDSKIPVALEQFLKEHPTIEKIYMHFDNDNVGRLATRIIISKLSDCYEIIDNPPPRGKDVNDFLCSKLGIIRNKERGFER